MKHYNIFLASSYELESERREFEIFIGRENKRLKNKNVFLSLEIWEDMDGALNSGCKQADYNERLVKCDICVLLFWTKVGKFTLEEFELAYQLYQDNSRPRIYVYEKTLPPNSLPHEWEKQSKEEFLKRLKLPGKEQFQIPFSNYAELESNFKTSLYDLFEEGFLTYGEPAKMLSINGPAEPVFFVGREDELKKMDSRLDSLGKTLLINSEGGLGKTSLAAKFWYNNLYKFKYNAWLYCEKGIIDAIKTLAPQIGISLKGLEENDQYNELKKALLKFHNDFLLVLDNANNEEEIFRFKKMFKGFQWKVIFTSRCKQILDSEEELEISSLSPLYSKMLFIKYYKEDGEDFNSLLERFLSIISYNTLLIEIFAKNLRETSGLGMTMINFVEKLNTRGLYLEEESFEVRTGYLEKEDKRMLTTDEILDILYDLSELENDHQSLLITLALLPAERYTVEFLIYLCQPNNKLWFAKCIKRLFEKGWLGGSKKEYRMSPLVQQVTLRKSKERLWSEGKNLIKALNSNMSHEVSSGEIAKLHNMVPIFESIYPIFLKIADKDYAKFLNYGSVLLYSIGGRIFLERAKSCLELAIDINEQIFGLNAPEVNDFRSNYSNLLRHLGGQENLLRAQSVLKDAIEFDAVEFGADSRQVSRHYSNLGGVLKALGGRENLLEAVSFLEKSLLIEAKMVPLDELKIAMRNSNLSVIYLDLGDRYRSLAKEKAERALQLYRVYLDDDSVDVIRAKGNLALILNSYEEEDKSEQALRLAREALDASINAFGTYCLFTSRMQTILAEILRDMGGEDNLKEAEEKILNSLSWASQNSNSNMTLLFNNRCLLASVYYELGGLMNLKKAQFILQEYVDTHTPSESVHILYKKVLSKLEDLGDVKEFE